MNYDLAMMALDGLKRSPITIRIEGGNVHIEGEHAGFKDLARLFLLLGGSESADAEDGIELQPGVHLTADSPALTMRLTG
ncbi:MAG TPA: hypothetical protein VEZ11_16415 [Thermoanaerobaculia bacterium]|nr:hypothetical protein [Thermoanaerobaculia bacterium]